jgi:phage shock protein PspC (stress-responsive transcriptional regulator)
MAGGLMTDVSRPLRRSRTNRQIAGVVGGLAEYFKVDVTLLRVIYVVGSIASAAFPGVLVYLLLWLLIPEGDDVPGAGT